MTTLFSLTPSQLAIQTLARQFARDEVAPLAREADETGIFPLYLGGWENYKPARR